jgi:FlaA1/EpsC-like NDP-sugar epimerase
MTATPIDASDVRAPLAARVARARADVVAILLDIVLVAAALVTTFLLRYDGLIPQAAWSRFFQALPLVAAVVVVANGACGLYSQIWRHASVVEARRVLAAAAVSCGAFAMLSVIGYTTVRPAVTLTMVLVYSIYASVIRFQSRLFAVNRSTSRGAPDVRVLIIGAGSAGAILVREMRQAVPTASRGRMVAVGFLDDNPRKHGRKLLGIPVLGPVSALAREAGRIQVDEVLLAVSDAEPELVRQVCDQAEEAGVPVRTVPRVEDRTHARLALSDLQNLRIDDLLGRPQVTTDLEGVRRIVSGKRVLVTGAGGSIGSEIARQISRLDPAELLLLDHDETHLHDACATIERPVVQLLADIRQRGIINQIFIRHQPQVVFHAAAHKHVPLLESHPCEAVRTNVWGTDNLVAAALAAQVDHFVFISTDKAVRPSSVMGATKRLAEHLVLSSATRESVMCAVRFGNVLGSRGSVVPTFLRQIDDGGPVTVTDARMTRYFMTIPEAVQLVLQSSALAKGGEVFILDMGEPVNIRHLAERLIRLRGRRVGTDVEIRVTGVRPGEKLEEELTNAEETPSPTAHPSIMRITPQPLPTRTLSRAVESLNLIAEQGLDEPARALLFDLAEDRLDKVLSSLRPRRRASDGARPELGTPFHTPRRRTSDVQAAVGASHSDAALQEQA